MSVWAAGIGAAVSIGGSIFGASRAKKQRRKAEFYHRFTLLEKGFKIWKIFTKEEKDTRERQKWIKAVFFDETRLLRY